MKFLRELLENIEQERSHEYVAFWAADEMEYSISGTDDPGYIEASHDILQGNQGPHYSEECSLNDGLEMLGQCISVWSSKPNNRRISFNAGAISKFKEQCQMLPNPKFIFCEKGNRDDEDYVIFLLCTNKQVSTHT